MKAFLSHGGNEAAFVDRHHQRRTPPWHYREDIDRSRLDEAMALLKKQEETYLALGNLSATKATSRAVTGFRVSSGKSATTPIQARRLLEQALAIFTERCMPREKEAVEQALAEL